MRDRTGTPPALRRGAVRNEPGAFGICIAGADKQNCGHERKTIMSQMKREALLRFRAAGDERRARNREPQAQCYRLLPGGQAMRSENCVDAGSPSSSNWSSAGWAALPAAELSRCCGAGQTDGRPRRRLSPCDSRSRFAIASSNKSRSARSSARILLTSMVCSSRSRRTAVQQARACPAAGSITGSVVARDAAPKICGFPRNRRLRILTTAPRLSVLTTRPTTIN